MKTKHGYEYDGDAGAISKALAAASNAFHEDPRNPSTCEAYRENDNHHRACPCDNDWRKFMKPKAT